MMTLRAARRRNRIEQRWLPPTSLDLPSGTRVRLFPQTPVHGENIEPETVVLSTPPELIGPGPSDDRMYVIDPLDKPFAYGRNAAPTGPPPFLPDTALVWSSLPARFAKRRRPSRSNPSRHARI